MVNINQNPPWFRTADRCPYSGLPVSHYEKYISPYDNARYSFEVARLGDHIALCKASGYTRSFEMQEWKNFMDDFISRNFDIKTGIVYIEDYTDVQGADAEARKTYINYYVSLRQRQVLIAAVLYKQSILFKISYNIAKRFYPIADAYNVSTYMQAINLALKLLEEGEEEIRGSLGGIHPFHSFFNSITKKISVLPKHFAESFKTFRRPTFFLPFRGIRRENTEALLKYIESINWHENGVKDPEGEIFSDPSMKQVAAAISYIKSEVDGLLKERDAAGEILRQSEARYRRLVEHAKAGILEFDYETRRIISVNESFLEICGYSEKEITRLAPEDLMTAPSRKLFLERLENRMKGSPLQDDAIYEFFTKNGERKWVLLTATVFEAANRPQKADIIIIDITPMKMVEARLMEYQGRLKALSMALSRAEEGERRNLASHLHEKVGQELFVAQLRLAAMKKTLTTPIQHQHLDAVNEQIVKTIQEIRGITYDLSPPVLYELGLADALSSLARTLEARHGLKIDVTVKGDAEKCHDEIKHIFYRAAREILHNTVKHARADEAGIYLEITEHDLFMDISDNGVGFDTAPFSENHYTGQGFGFFDIREKVQNLGGSLHICSTPGEGTRVSLAVPLSSDPA